MPKLPKMARSVVTIKIIANKKSFGMLFTRQGQIKDIFSDPTIFNHPS
jgi:hypothetical protein